ncbi:LAG1-DNAbind-domain-containing protein [Backusella circina FSU 941]|nr:LAG1-DNAbind-domain-containing protein [Backusella circina FSU 941]
MKPAIQNYLDADDPIEAGERTVIIMTSKVAQKSYGTEKRFLCPPPTAILVGSSWLNVMRAPPTLAICISGESSGQQQGSIEWYNVSGKLVGQTGSSIIKPIQQQQQIKNSSDAGGRCVLKRLYINDADEKRKKVECLVKVQLANGLMLGTLSSRGIKVISKPSKKRQSVKNIELCIYHGTTVSLFNRIRSQTVSTKYLGVSSTNGEASSFEYPGRLQNQKNNTNNNSDTCFVARTGNWDPFIVWIIDPSQEKVTEETNATSRADEYIGCPSIVPTIPYPNPPTIALKNKTKQPLAIRYNQHIVLQCLTTGLVSPVMIIRKIDKASTVVGGAACPDELDPSLGGGGECGDEVLGDPVSQLHKIALQIVQPESIFNQANQQSEYGRYPTNGDAQYAYHNQFGIPIPNQKQSMHRMPQMNSGSSIYLACLNDIVGTHKSNNKRLPIKRTDGAGIRRRVSSLNDVQRFPNATSSHEKIIHRSHSISSNYSSQSDLGAFWSEDVTDAAVWTVVGTECARYTFWTPPHLDENKQQNEQQTTAPLSTPFPCLQHFVISNEHYIEPKRAVKPQGSSDDGDTQRIPATMMTVSGENFTRDLQIWFGDIKAPLTEYRSREMLVCRLPSREELLQSVGLIRNDAATIINNDDDDCKKPGMPFSIRILLVRGDGVVYKTSRSYSFY